MKPLCSVQQVAVTDLHDRLSSVRLSEPEVVETIQQSLARNGQLSALKTFEQEGALQVYDGLKRLQAARKLNWESLWVETYELTEVQAKLRMAQVHTGRGLSELEEGWLIRSLVRDHRLTQGQIGQQLGRDKSWVCRRQMLVEAIEAQLQAQVRLGLLAPRAAVVLAALPRGNQVPACEAVVRWSLTVRQTQQLVERLMQCGSEAKRQELLARKPEFASKATPDRGDRNKYRSEAEWMSRDIDMLQQIAARLQARLAGGSVHTCSLAAQDLMAEALRSLVPILERLTQSIEDTIPGLQEQET